MASSFDLDVTRLNNGVDKRGDLWYNIVTKERRNSNGS